MIQNIKLLEINLNHEFQAPKLEIKILIILLEIRVRI